MSPLDFSSCCDVVGRSRLFAEVPPEPMNRALKAIRVLEFSPGAEVIAESVAGAAKGDSALYVLIEGHLSVARTIGPGRTEALSTIQPGEFFGELVLADDGTRSATVTAVTPAVVGQLAGAATEQLIQDAPV